MIKKNKMKGGFFLLFFIACLHPSFSKGVLTEKELVRRILSMYPPYLVSLIEEDLAKAKVTQALGGFDSTLSISTRLQPQNYYDGSIYEFKLERPFESIGGFLYGGYRLSDGFLPSYERKYRTGSGGEAFLGVRVPLWKDRKFDKRRAELSKAELRKEMADPLIATQLLEVLRLGRSSYYQWLVKGRFYFAMEELLQVANERQESLEKEVLHGSRPEIILIENKQTVVRRTLARNNARTDFENAALTLSLFFRNLKSGKPERLNANMLPKELSRLPVLTKRQNGEAIRTALEKHPKIKLLHIDKERKEIDLKLARNDRKPNLDFALEGNQAFGDNVPSDIDETEFSMFLKFSVPIGRNEAKGREAEALEMLKQIDLNLKFVKESMTNEIAQYQNSLKNNFESFSLSNTAESLSLQLLEAEHKKFKYGSSGILELQIREKSYMDSRVYRLSSCLKYLLSYTDYLSKICYDLP